MTATSDAIKRLISYAWNDWMVTMDEQKAVIALMRTDGNLAATLGALNSDNMLGALVSRVNDNAYKRPLAEMLGNGARPSTKTVIGIYLATSHGAVEPFVFSYELHNAFRGMGAAFTATSFSSSPYAALVPTEKTKPFGGVGATGTNPSTLSIPYADQLRMLANDAATTAAYSNPIPGDLSAYLASVGPTNRINQAKLLIQQPISTVLPYSYRSTLPSRAAIMKLAGAAHSIEPALIAGFILAEQRDQSQKEDAKDYTAATSLVSANTSIGLGQVVISTARKSDLFSDLLSESRRKDLTHGQIAKLLASDEFNIFAVAKYLRLTANQGAAKTAASLPKTMAKFPGLVLAKYAMHSSGWPEDNISALGSEYTSRPWDDNLSPGWGDFVLEAYKDAKASASF
jgi:hypothetical protein